MHTITEAYNVLLWIAAVFISLSACACLVRGILGPRFTDRIVAINVICTKAVIMIALLSCILGDSHLLDIAVLYAMISFLAVVVLSKCYLSSRRIKHSDPAPMQAAQRDPPENKEGIL